MAGPTGDQTTIRDSGAGLRSRRRFGIYSRMLVAFTVVAAMAVTSAVVAWLSLRRIEAELVEVVHDAVPAVSIAEALAAEASAIVGATSTLTAALDEGQHEKLKSELIAKTEMLNQRLDMLGRLRADQKALESLRGLISSLSANLNRQSDIVGQRIVLRNHVRDSAAQLALSHNEFLTAVDPHIDQTYRSLFAGIKTLVSDLGSTGQQSFSSDAGQRPRADALFHQGIMELQRRIGMLFNRNVGEMLALLQLADAGNLADGLLNEVILVTDAAQLHQLRNRFNEITISMGAIRLNLTTTPENQILLGLTTPLLQYGLGSDNLFDSRLHELELIKASDAVVAENHRLSDALTRAVEGLVSSARVKAEHAAKVVEEDAAYVRVMEATAALLAVLLALVIGWR